MNKNIFHKKIPAAICIMLLCLFSLLFATSFSVKRHAVTRNGTLKISFINTANGNPIVLRDSLYSNYFGEQYSISKLKYYISNIVMKSGNKSSNIGGYYLINAASDENSFEISLEPGNYSSLQFLVGVDSIKNCSGAQTGALDPMNDMFWTWNSGYVMFKLEGNSPVAASDLNRIEHHLGGYKGINNVVTEINLDLSAKNFPEIKAGSTTELVIENNLDNYWHGTRDIKISEFPVCVITGELAKKISSNFKKLFSIKRIQ